MGSFAMILKKLMILDMQTIIPISSIERPGSKANLICNRLKALSREGAALMIGTFSK